MNYKIKSIILKAIDSDVDMKAEIAKSLKKHTWSIQRYIRENALNGELTKPCVTDIITKRFDIPLKEQFETSK